MITINKKRAKQQINAGIISVLTTFNNTLITVSDLIGNTLCWTSSGLAGFKGARKSTPFAAQITTKALAQKLTDLGFKYAELKFSGRGNARESVIRTLKQIGIVILSIEDKTTIPYNGCRPPKKRRL